jgi:hypothetical protein
MYNISYLYTSAAQKQGMVKIKKYIWHLLGVIWTKRNALNDKIDDSSLQIDNDFHQSVKTFWLIRASTLLESLNFFTLSYEVILTTVQYIFRVIYLKEKIISHMKFVIELFVKNLRK